MAPTRTCPHVTARTTYLGKNPTRTIITGDPVPPVRGGREMIG
jgi:hypothetical protein